MNKYIKISLIVLLVISIGVGMFITGFFTHKYFQSNKVMIPSSTKNSDDTNINNILPIKKTKDINLENEFSNNYRYLDKKDKSKITVYSVKNMDGSSYLYQEKFATSSGKSTLEARMLDDSNDTYKMFYGFTTTTLTSGYSKKSKILSLESYGDNAYGILDVKYSDNKNKIFFTFDKGGISTHISVYSYDFKNGMLILEVDNVKDWMTSGSSLVPYKITQDEKNIIFVTRQCIGGCGGSGMGLNNYIYNREKKTYKVVGEPSNFEIIDNNNYKYKIFEWRKCTEEESNIGEGACFKDPAEKPWKYGKF